MIADGLTAKVNQLGSRRQSQTAAARVARSQSSFVHDGVSARRAARAKLPDRDRKASAEHRLTLAKDVALHHSISQISQLAAAIEREMAIKTQVNAYLSFSKGGALKPHWDIHDVLVVQVLYPGGFIHPTKAKRSESVRPILTMLIRDTEEIVNGESQAAAWRGAFEVVKRPLSGGGGHHPPD